MTLEATPDDRQLALAPLDDKVDHVRGSPAGRLIIEYGDYECPYSRQAFYAIQQVERRLGGNMRFTYRHFPLTSIHPHALAAAVAAEAAALQDRFWDMHELLFHRQEALEASDLLGVCRPARPRRGGVRPRPGQHRDGGADPPGCGQRPGLAPGAGHADPVHRRHRPPRRLRPARPAGRAGPISRSVRMPCRIRLTQQADTVAGCEDCLATSRR